MVNEGRKPLSFWLGDKVKLSTLFLRSIANRHECAESMGIIIKMVCKVGDWRLVTVKWDNGREGSINAQNLVHFEECGREAQYVEHSKNIPGIVIGSNGYLKFNS